MKKYIAFAVLVLSTLACATLTKPLDQEPTANPSAVPSLVNPQQTAAPQATVAPTATSGVINRKETTGVQCPSDNIDASDAYNKAVTYESAGDTDSAIQAYRDAINFDPKYCDAMDNLAYLLRQSGNVDEAITWYQLSISIKPDNEVPHLGLANAYSSLKQYDSALKEYAALLDIDPNNPEGYYGAGSVYFAQEKYNDALEQFKKAEELYKNEGSDYIVDAQLYIGITYVKLEDYEMGRDYIEMAYPYFKDNAYVNYMLGSCYYYGKTIRNEELAKQYLTSARDLGYELEPELETFINTP